MYIYKSLSAYLSSVSCAFPFLSEKDYGKTNGLTSTHYRILSPFLKNSTKASHQQNCHAKVNNHPAVLNLLKPGFNRREGLALGLQILGQKDCGHMTQMLI